MRLPKISWLIVVEFLLVWNCFSIKAPAQESTNLPPEEVSAIDEMKAPSESDAPTDLPGEPELPEPVLDDADVDAAAADATQATGDEVVYPPSQPDEEMFGPPIKEIEIEYAGPKSVSKAVILSNMRTTVGQPYSQAAIEEDVRNLYETGLFVNLRIYDEPLADGVKIILIVQPKPLVRQVSLVGWSEVPEGRLYKEVKTKAGEVLNEQQVAKDAMALEAYYQKKGFKDAQVTYQIDTSEETGRSAVTFNISESGRQYLNSIQFVGNDSFPNKRLRKEFKTKKRGLLSWLTGTGVVKEDQFQDDLIALKRFYQNQGFIDMEIQGVEFRRVGDEDVDAVITVSEGIPYKVGSVTLEGYVVYSKERIRNRMRMLEGGIYSPLGLETDLKSIRDLYGEQGYIDAEVVPTRRPSIESGRMDLVYNISEGPQGFVERIIIQGNNKTKDKVIRRELAVAPGDVYNSVRADASKKRLENLNYFSKVDISPQETAIPSRKNMVVTVEESRTGSFTFGAGYSSIDSFIGFAEFSQGNFDIANWPSFIGGGQKFRTRLQYGDKRQDFTISFVEPWFMNQRLSFGVDLFYRNASYFSSYYDEQRVGAHFKFAKALNDFLTARAIYKIESINLDVKGDAPLFLEPESGSRIRNAVEFGLTHDTRDSVFLTRKGHRIDGSLEIAAGGDVELYKIAFEAEQYFSLPLDMILSLQGNVAVVDSFGGGDVPIFDRLFAGGSNSIRGFKFRDVGPKYEPDTFPALDDERDRIDEINRELERDDLSEDEEDDLNDEKDDLEDEIDDQEDYEGTPVGGKTMAYGNVELTFPIFSRVRGAVFVDAGFVNAAAFDFSPNNFNVGAGIGLRLNLPIGPLRLDLGMPLVTDKYNDDGPQFHFNVGYQF